jgi:Undecaprenyl-phosphate glucose phosphotransferase
VPATLDGGVPWLGGSGDLLDYVDAHPVDTVVIALPLVADHRIARLVAELRQRPIDVRILPDFLGLEVATRPRTDPWADIPGMLLVPVANRPIAGWNAVLKTIEDKLVAALALLLFGPLMLLIALAIRLDSPGPALYRQVRLGYNQREFAILKFRTMRREACTAHAGRLTVRDDPRVTRLGALLRKTSLDELPQLLNVLRGEMSIVGPRPHASTARAGDVTYDAAVAAYAARHRVKPGLTGWAQVNGWRGPTETIEQIRQRVAHDIHYIDHWSIGFDLWIMFLTVFKGFVNRNAY